MNVLFEACPAYDYLRIDRESSIAKARDIRDVEKFLERNTSKDRSKGHEGEVRASRLPPKWLAELGKAVLEAITIWDTIVYWWEVDSALRIGGVKQIASD